ncbi:MAG: hypothetical protein AAB891_02095 [Patescibacteria group bacterium]
MNPTQPNQPLGAGQKSRAVLVTGIVAIIILVLAALYLSREDFLGGPADPVTDALQEQSSSDELDSIEADLNATPLENLEGDFEAAVGE